MCLLTYLDLCEVSLKNIKSRRMLSSYKNLMGEWDYEKNEGLDPCKLTHGSHKKVWWICNNSECKHEWPAMINNRTRGRGCPACAGRVVTENNCLATTHPELSKGWHPTKNGNLTPHDVI
jgi:hypothetical protein